MMAKSFPPTRIIRLFSWATLAVVILVIELVITPHVKQGSILVIHGEAIRFLLLLVATAVATLNAVQNRQSIRLFWSFLATGYGLWALNQLGWIYYVVVLGKDRPDFLFGSTPLFLHTALMIAAVASRPHLKLSRDRPYLSTLNFLLLLFFWIWLYAYILFPYTYAPVTLLRFQAYYLAENLMLFAVLGMLIVRAKPPWKSIYWHLLGASTLYISASLWANLKLALNGTDTGLYDIPFDAAVLWFLWVALLGQKPAPQLAQSVQPETGDTKYAPLLAMVSMLSVLAVPAIGVWELFRPDEPYRTRLVRLLIVLVSVLLLGVFAFVKEYLANRELSSDVGLANERLRLAVNAGRMYAFEWDAETDLIVRTEKSTKILKWIDADTGRLFIARVHPDDREAYAATVTGRTPENPTYQTSYRMVWPDGGTVWLEESGHTFFNDKGTMLRTIGTVVDITEQKLAEEALASVSRRLIEAQEKERTRIARELHDDIGQRLALFAIELEQLRQYSPDLPAEVLTRLGELQKQTSGVASDIQSMSHELHSSKLEYLGIVTAMRGFCKEFSAQHKVEIDFVHGEIPAELPQEIAICLFRVLQEALQNALKYSGVRQFDVELGYASDEIHLTVRDSGSGFNCEAAKNGRGLGLISMEERLKLLNGRFLIESQPKRGTTIHARVPLSSGVGPSPLLRMARPA